MQNKPNLQNVEMNVTTFITKEYENFRPYGRCKNKPNFIRRSTPVLRSSKSEEGSEGGLTQFRLCNSPALAVKWLPKIKNLTVWLKK